MTDEIFRDHFCDDIFHSMKAQMEPSDDVVASLLSKIAAEAPSSVTENDNVIPFRQPAEIAAEKTAAAAVAALESTPRKHFASKKTNKSIWYYGTAVAASVIVMISTFALLDTDGDDASGVKDLFNQAVGTNTQIVDSDHTGEEAPLPKDEETAVPSDDKDSDEADSQNPDQQMSSDGADSNAEDTPQKSDTPSGENTQASNLPENDEHGNSDSSDITGNTSDSEGKNENADSSAPQNPDQNERPDGTESSGGNGSDADASAGNDQEPDSSDKDSSDSSKVTPGSEGTEEIPWTNEIISTSQVASIFVSGGNYVVENTVSRSDVGATLEVVTITLPQTSTTNAAEVTAKVRELKNVSAAAMVALDVEGFDQPLVYANTDYTPATLGQFVSDLGLEKKTSFSSNVRCQISMVGYSSNHSYTTDISSAVWTYLLNHSSAERANFNSFSSGNAKALFTSDSNPTGSQIQFGVSDNGYLYVSMMGKKHTFHIGSDGAKGFIEYVIGEPLE